MFSPHRGGPSFLNSRSHALGFVLLLTSCVTAAGRVASKTKEMSGVPILSGIVRRVLTQTPRKPGLRTVPDETAAALCSHAELIGSGHSICRSRPGGEQRWR